MDNFRCGDSPHGKALADVHTVGMEPSSDINMASSRTSPIRSAFSLVEVMISLSILAVVTSALFSGIFGLAQASGMNRQQAQARALTLALSNAFAAAPFERLRTTQLRWSLGRFCPTGGALPPTIALAPFPAGDAVVPLTDDPNAASDRCLLRYTATGVAGLGVLDAPTGLADLKVWVEYYRGSDFDKDGDGIIQATPSLGEAGLIDTPPASVLPLIMPPVHYANHAANLSDPLLVGYRLAGSPKDQADPEGTVLIRVVMTYRMDAAGGDADNYFLTSFVVSRRR